MKLVYLYIEKHKVLEKIEATFSSEHQVQFDGQKLNIIKCKSNFDYYNGIQTTAIIGKNGTGKSTLLDFIESSYSNTESESSGFSIWLDDNEYYICPINYDFESIIVKSNSLFKINIDYRKLLNNKKVRLVKANNLSGAESNTITRRTRKNIFSYDLSLAQYNSGSSSKLAKKITRLMSFFIESSWVNRTQNLKVEFEFEFKSSSVTYLKNILKKDELIHEINLSSGNLDLLKQLQRVEPPCIFDSIVEQNPFLFLELLEKNILSILRFSTKYSGFNSNFQDYIFIKLLLVYYNEGYDKINLDVISDILIGSRFYKNSHIPGIVQTDSLVVFKRFTDAIKVLLIICDIIISNKSDIKYKQINKFTSSNPSLIINLMSAISKLPAYLVSNFHYGWKGFSTGEFAKLNLFSELYYFISDEKRKDGENYIIVMDEVDLYLHPDWQREFLNDTLAFLKSEYPSNKVQLIISSHSPIIIGDFLPDDIISLYRENGDSPKIGHSYGFGIPILQLYMDGMHLNSTFGSHSKKYIDKIIKNKMENNLSEKDKFLIEKIKNKNIREMLGENE
ncbi:AAA family ATPase [Acinetobacter oleivorans]|uniref:AAA family ATPase n=1 Tax=Acinetobacter oleivorans TaxID=1148157 RepID=UPI003F7CB5C9